MSKEIFNGCIGIDLGTTFSCVSVWMDDHVEVIPNSLGNRITPSWISFNGNERLIGELAKQQFSSNPKNTVYDVKRFIGKIYSDPQLQEDLQHYSFKIVPDEFDRPLVEIELNGQPQRYRPEELSGMILAEMKSITEAYLNKRVTNAIITCPAYFSGGQRASTQQAAEISGLNCLRIINEPTASCLCYGLQNKKSCTILTVDLGGGTFDNSILSLNEGEFEDS